MSTTFITSQPILKWPTQLRPSSISIQARSNTSRFTSPFTRTSQTQALPGALFSLSASFPALNEDKARQARAMLARLRGSAGRFYFPANRCGYEVPSAYAPERTNIVPLSVDLTKIKADSTVITADRTEIVLESIFTPDGTGSSTVINGTLWVNSGRAPVRIGNHLSFDDATGWRHLHVMVDVQFDPLTGVGSITVEPPMRERPTADTPIHIHYPSGVFMLNDDAQGAISSAPGGMNSLQIEGTQAFPLKVIV